MRLAHQLLDEVAILAGSSEAARLEVFAKREEQLVVINEPVLVIAKLRISFGCSLVAALARDALGGEELLLRGLNAASQQRRERARAVGKHQRVACVEENGANRHGTSIVDEATSPRSHEDAKDRQSSRLRAFVVKITRR